ncbi:MAG TPA: efflux RND transporter periplasmic adaptor subunit [Arachnia sp.]|nr:efflux RND transporter periplasmic adaptor subunit [Arachnia sp.]HMR12894.1 efflux RND transporter periplasmic adaptor subunit [Arachnia sp.]
MTTDAARQSPTGRRLRILVVLLALAIVFALGGFVASRFMVTPAQRDALAAPPPASVLTAAVTSRELSDSVVTRGDVAVLAAVDVLEGRAFPGSPAIVTAAPVVTGDEAKAGSVLLEVNGRPVLALPGDLPAYEDLTTGAEGPLVAQLQKALKATGAKITDDKGVFGASTAAGVAKLYTDAGYAAREALPMAEVAFLPTLPARVVSSTAARGRSAADASLVVAAGNPVVVVGQPDRQLTELASEGVAARIANELSGEAFDATFSTNQAAPSGADEQDAAGTPDAASLVVVPNEPLPLPWIGANVRVSVDLRTTDGPVLTVPMAAVRTDGGGRTVVTVVDGDARRDVEVSPGVTGDGFVAIEGEVAEGDEVLVGVAS